MQWLKIKYYKDVLYSLEARFKKLILATERKVMCYIQISKIKIATMAAKMLKLKESESESIIG